MPVATAARPVSLPALQAAHSSARTDLNAAKAALKAQLAPLRKALTGIENAARDFPGEARAHAAHPQSPLGKTLASQLKMVQSLPSSTELRLKADGRVVAAASQSWWKNCVGWGAAQRAQQAADLAKQPGLENAGQPVTKQVLRDASIERAWKDAADQFQIKLQHALTEVGRHLADVSDAASGPYLMKNADTYARYLLGNTGDKNARSYTKADVSNVITKNGLFELFGGIKREDLLNAATQRRFAEFVGDVKTTIAEAKDERFSALRKVESDALTELRAAESASKVGACQALLKQHKVQWPGREAIADLTNRLEKLTREGAFGAVYHTNKGCRAIQEMCDGVRSSLSGKTVRSEIQLRHGDDVFSRGARKEGDALVAYADLLTPDKVKQIFQVGYALEVAKFAHGQGGYSTRYRQAAHSLSMIQAMQQMAGSSQLLRPTRFMSTAAQNTNAAIGSFPVERQPGLETVRFTVEGFSGMSISSQWSFVGESEGEVAYTPDSCFQVRSVTKEQGIWQVRLVEQPVTPQARALANKLTV